MTAMHHPPPIINRMATQGPVNRGHQNKQLKQREMVSNVLTSQIKLFALSCDDLTCPFSCR